MILPGHVFSVVGDHRVVLYEFDSVLDTVLVPHHDPTDAAAFDGVLSKDEPKVSSRLFRYPHQTVECVDRMFAALQNLTIRQTFAPEIMDIHDFW